MHLQTELLGLYFISLNALYWGCKSERVARASLRQTDLFNNYGFDHRRCAALPLIITIVLLVETLW